MRRVAHRRVTRAAQGRCRTIVAVWLNLPPRHRPTTRSPTRSRRRGDRKGATRRARFLIFPGKKEGRHEWRPYENMAVAGAQCFFFAGAPFFALSSVCAPVLTFGAWPWATPSALSAWSRSAFASASDTSEVWPLATFSCSTRLPSSPQPTLVVASTWRDPTGEDSRTIAHGLSSLYAIL